MMFISFYSEESKRLCSGLGSPLCIDPVIEMLFPSGVLRMMGKENIHFVNLNAFTDINGDMSSFWQRYVTALARGRCHSLLSKVYQLEKYSVAIY